MVKMVRQKGVEKNEKDSRKGANKRRPYSKYLNELSRSDLDNSGNLFNHRPAE